MPNIVQVVRLAATIALLSANATWATPIKFVYTGVGSGTINGVPFAASAFTITAFADTSSRQSCTVGVCVFVNHITASIAISGIGAFDLLTPTETLVGGGIVFFAHAGPSASNLYDLAADPPLLDNYELDRSIGPIIAFGSLNQWTALPLINTSGGILIFDDTVGQGSPGSFQATLLPAPSQFEVPTLSKAAIVALGILLLVVAVGHRSRDRR